jgi:hypothetical protein
MKPSASKLLKISLWFFLSAVLYSFTAAPRQDDEASELARLMRQMYTDSEQIKTAVLERRLPADFREKFRAIHTATPTDPAVRDKNFAAFSKNFLKSLDRVYVGKNQVDNFNKMVNNCLACHASYCPGPMNRIKKLTIIASK